jgi:hypothetical protein
MKKTILIPALLFMSAISYGQTAKKDTTKTKVQYDKFVKVPPQVYEYFLNIVHNYRDNLIYIPMLTPAEKLTSQQNIDRAIFGIKDLKIDSALITPKIT